MNIERTSQARAIQATTAQQQGEPRAKYDDMAQQQLLTIVQTVLRSS